MVLWSYTEGKALETLALQSRAVCQESLLIRRIPCLCIRAFTKKSTLEEFTDIATAMAVAINSIQVKSDAKSGQPLRYASLRS